nr:hypothetical protein [Tanacetum cinerariifolium]
MDLSDYEVPRVLVTCRSILQLVILGVESRLVVPDWMLRLVNDRVAWNKYPWGSYVWPTLYSQLRNANFKRWSPLYVAQPTNEDDVKTYSIFGYTWAFKILESFRVTAIMYFDRYNRYPRVAAWSKKKGKGNMPAARLTPDDNDARSDWWISKIERNKKEVDNIKEEMRKFRQEMNVQPVRQENKEPIIVEQHYGLSDFSQFQSMQSGPSSFQRHVNSSYFNMGTPSNFQTPMPSQPGSSDWQRQMPAYHLIWVGQICKPLLRRIMMLMAYLTRIFRIEKKREQIPNKYKLTPFMEQPPTTILPKQRINKTKNKGKKATLSPLNLRGAFEDGNVEDNNVMFFGFQFTGNFLMYENVEPTKHMNSWMKLLIGRRNAKANWTVAYTSTISVHPKNNRFIIPTDQHVIGTLDGTTRSYPAWNDVDWVFMHIHVAGNH